MSNQPKHTEGPWNVISGSGLNGYVIVDKHDNFIAEAETKEDAALIAASPLLLQAAQALMQNARDTGECFIDKDSDDFDPENPEQMYADWAQLDAAIRKATNT